MCLGRGISKSSVVTASNLCTSGLHLCTLTACRVKNISVRENERSEVSMRKNKGCGLKKESVMCCRWGQSLKKEREGGQKGELFISLIKKALLCFSCFSFFSPFFGSCIASGKALGIISYFVPVNVFLSACGECFSRSLTESLAALLQGPQGCHVVMYFL